MNTILGEFDSEVSVDVDAVSLSRSPVPRILYCGSDHSPRFVKQNICMSFNNQQSQEEEERGGREAQVKYEKGRTSPLAARQVPESTMRKERLAVRARHHQTGSRTEY